MEKSKTLRKLKTLFGPSRRPGRVAGKARSPARSSCDVVEGYGRPSVIHATIVIFLEFFAWGLLTSPTIEALKTAFPTGTFLKNGIVQGIKGLLSFLSAPLIGALSDAWGRKSFLLLSVFMTCAPIPILLFSAVAYFIAVAVSGIFAVTFSIVFAYVADCTSEVDRSSAYGLVSATFAASLVISPSLGTWIDGHSHGQAQVILLATMITTFNLVFIIFMVPESLPERSRKASWGSPITWEQADPFSSLRRATTDFRLLHLSVMVFLSYLPEAGQYSCFFLYLRQVVGFSLPQVAIFIAVLCVMSVLAQTLGLTLLMSLVGHKYTIIVGLVLQATQLCIYGIWTTPWLMWLAGILAASSSIIYPAISAMVSRNAEPEQQGVVLGILTGMRGLCNGLGPALFGLLFWMTDVHLSEEGGNTGVHPGLADAQATSLPSTIITNVTTPTTSTHTTHHNQMFLGIPFLIGAFPVVLALLVAFCIREKGPIIRKSPSEEHIPLRNTEHRQLHNSISSNS